MGILQGEVHGLSTDTAHGLGCIDPLLILLKLSPVCSIMVRSVSCCHIFHQHKRTVLPSLCVSLYLLLEEPVAGIAPAR